MTKIIMLDTNICSYIMKGQPAVKDNVSIAMVKRVLIPGLPGICISSIVLAELEFGVSKNKKYRDAVNEFLKMVDVIDFDASAAQHYADIRQVLTSQGSIIGGNDLLIAAHARSVGAALITNNTREFQRVPSLIIEDWTLDRDSLKPTINI